MLQCISAEDTDHLQHILEKYRYMQRLAWRNRYHNDPNPLEGMSITRIGRDIALRVTTAYTQGSFMTLTVSGAKGIDAEASLKFRRCVLGLCLLAGRVRSSYNLRQVCLLVQKSGMQPHCRSATGQPLKSGASSP
jgi:hypothetical protein